MRMIIQGAQEKTKYLGAFAALYFLMFAALGAEIPFLPNVLSSAGLSAFGVGAVLAAGTCTQIGAAPVFGSLADRVGAKLVFLFAAVASAASLVCLLLSLNGFWTGLLCYLLFALATMPLNPLADAMAVPYYLKVGIPYGRVRGVGSAGFLFGVLLSSVIAARFGFATGIFTAVVLFLLTIATSPFFPPVEIRSKQEESTGGMRTLLRIAAFRRVLLVAAMVIGSHAMSDAFAVIHWRATGVPSQTIGAMLALGVLSELLCFALVGPMILARLGPSTSAMIGAAAGALRWTVLAEAISVWPVLATQLLHGLTFSLVHLACMQVLASAAPKRFFATAQSLYGICSNAVASAIITLTSGALFGVLGSHAFLLAAALCVLALPVARRMGASNGSGTSEDLGRRSTAGAHRRGPP